MSTRPPPIPSAMVHSRGGGGGGGGDEGGGGGGERGGGGRGGGGGREGGGGKGGEELNQSGQSAIASPLNLSTADIPQVQVIPLQITKREADNSNFFGLNTFTSSIML